MDILITDMKEGNKVQIKLSDYREKRRKGMRRNENRGRRAGGRGAVRRVRAGVVAEDKVQKGESKMKMEAGGRAGEVIVI